MWKVRSVENDRKFQFAISNAEKQSVNNKRKRKKRDETLHFKMCRAGMVISVVRSL